jgi:hypothetical protein
MNEKDRLRILDDIVIDDILALSESELRSRASEADLIMAHAAFEKACAIVGKATLAEARAALSLVSAGAKLVPGLELASTIPIFSTLNSGFAGQLTMAARNQTTDQREDQVGIDEDLAELKAWATKDASV